MQPPGIEPLARHALAFVLAGGRGSRLMELTDRRAKPAVYFGGKSRIIDFALSNAMNSGIRRIAVATQYKAHSLIRHLQMGWNFFRPERNESFDILPASQRVSETNWYLGTADAGLSEHRYRRAPWCQIHRAARRRPHLQDGLRTDAAQHVEQRADVTIGCLEVPRSESSGFGDHAGRRQRCHPYPSWKSRPIRRPCQASPTNRSPAWEFMCSTPNFCLKSCGATR